jgi:ATP-binding cassette subfamily B protein
MQTPFAHTAVQCLTAIAQHHGLQVNPERLIADYALGAEEPSHLLMLRMAADIGFKAKVESMSWEGLRAQGGVFPLIANTRIGTMVIVVGV